MGGEPGVSVRYHFLGQSKPLIDIVQIKVSDTFSHDGGRAGEEDGCSCTSMIDYCEYGVVWAILRELCDEVHRYFFERVCLRAWGDAVRRGVYSVRQVFVLLTGGASFDVVLDPLIHAGPPVPSFCGLYGFVSPWVSSGGCVVVVVHDPPPYSSSKNCPNVLPF